MSSLSRICSSGVPLLNPLPEREESVLLEHQRGVSLLRGPQDDGPAGVAAVVPDLQRLHRQLRLDEVPHPHLLFAHWEHGLIMLINYVNY